MSFQGDCKGGVLGEGNTITVLAVTIVLDIVRLDKPECRITDDVAEK